MKTVLLILQENLDDEQIKKGSVCFSSEQKALRK